MHGCARSARAFWPYHANNCPECMGFPEHVSHVKQALARGFNVVVMSPTDSKHGCWSSVWDNEGYTNDQPRVAGTLMQFLLNRRLTDKPIYLWGASSGGTFACVGGCGGRRQLRAARFSACCLPSAAPH